MSSLDRHQDIARSSYADMLHDDERHKLYDTAIKKCVRSLVSSDKFNPTRDKFFMCGDIGAGSGLLSMMIVRAFLELGYKNFHVTAFEEFKEMADCAERVIEANSMSDHITIIKQRSSEFKDRIDPFDLLVAELLDTELIGEECIATYMHASRYLCKPECLFIPHLGRIYAEPVASSHLFKRHAIDDLNLELDDGKSILIEVPEDVKNCPGIQQLDDLQLSSLREQEDFIRISEPVEVFSFQFKNPMSYRHAVINFPLRQDIEQPPVILSWWDIIMYDEHAIGPQAEPVETQEFKFPLKLLSCAPSWARDQEMLARDEELRRIYGRKVWREHWIQSAYYFADTEETRRAVGLEAGSDLTIHAYHNDLSIWFDLTEEGNSPFKPTSCDCSFHRTLLSRSKLAFLNDESVMKKLLASVLHEFKIYGILGRILVSKDDPTPWKIELDVDKTQVYFNDLGLTNSNPWAYLLDRYISNKCIRPAKQFTIKCCLVEFEDFHRIDTEIKYCEFFDLTLLSSLVTKSAQKADSGVQPYLLWEYVSWRRSQNFLVFQSDEALDKGANFDVHVRKVINRTLSAMFDLAITGDVKSRLGLALVFWVDVELQNTGDVISTGPTDSQNPLMNEQMKWCRTSPQLVYFMHSYPWAKPHGGDERVVLDALLGSGGYVYIDRAIDYQLPE